MKSEAENRLSKLIKNKGKQEIALNNNKTKFQTKLIGNARWVLAFSGTSLGINGVAICEKIV